MALICKKISKIEKIFSEKLKGQLSSLHSEKNLINFPKNLNSSLRIYLNLIDLNSTDSDINIVKEGFLEKLMKDIKLQDNFGNKGYFDSLIILLNEYKKAPTPTIKDKLTFLLEEINNNAEMFQKSQMENLVKAIQDNPSVYEIKMSIKNFNLFPKKLIKSRLVNTLKLPKSEHYNINVDIENNMIVLQDKKLDENLIVFSELTHSGSQSINFYNSLINTVKPNLVFLEQEPYENFDSYDGDKENAQLKFKSYIDDFYHLQEFKNFLKNNNCDRNYTLKGLDSIYNGNKELMEIESIIYGTLSKGIKISLFDLTQEEYLNTLLLFNAENNIEFFNEENKKIISILNNLEISAWINLQILKGCKNCSSFLTRSEIDWSPLSLEYIVNKKNLPNYNNTLLLQAKKIFSKIKETRNHKYIIFSSDSLNLASKFLEYSNNYIKSSQTFGAENDHFFTKFAESYKKDFSYNEENKAAMLNTITCGLLLKEKYNVFCNSPPFIVPKQFESEFIKEYKKEFLKNFDLFYNFENSDQINFDNNENSIHEQQRNDIHGLVKNQKLLRAKDCLPFNYIQHLKAIRSRMLDSDKMV